MLLKSVIAVAMLLLLALPSSAQEAAISTTDSSAADASGRTYEITASYYSFRNQDDFLLAVVRADRGQLHIEARYNYEAIDSGSLFGSKVRACAPTSVGFGNEALHAATA